MQLTRTRTLTLQRFALSECIPPSLFRACHLLSFQSMQEFNYKVLGLHDTPEQDVMSIFEEANKFITDCVNSGRRIFVHW